MGKYDDIISLPHHVSLKHPQMSMLERAAQFSPFAALSGHGAAIDETARLTADRIELEDDAKAMVDMRLRLAAEQTDPPVEVTVTYFLPDNKKAGGNYVTATGIIKKISENGSML